MALIRWLQPARATSRSCIFSHMSFFSHKLECKFLNLCVTLCWILSLVTAIKGCLSEFGLFPFGRALSSQPTPYQVLKIKHQKLQKDKVDNPTKDCRFHGFTFTFKLSVQKSCYRPLSGGCHLTGRIHPTKNRLQSLKIEPLAKKKGGDLNDMHH